MNAITRKTNHFQEMNMKISKANPEGVFTKALRIISTMCIRKQRERERGDD